MTVFDTRPPVAVGSDHAGFDLKSAVLSWLNDNKIPFKDFGTYTASPVDYPDFAHPVSDAVERGEFPFGILICGSGNGVAMAANKHTGIRAALCWENEIAGLARKHNNANILCLPARFISEEKAMEVVRVFLETEFEGGRHERRVNKISAC